MNWTYYGILLASNIGFLLAAISIKYYADGEGLTYLILGLLIANLSYIIHSNILASGFTNAALFSSVAYQVCLIAVGLLVFGERLNNYSIAGLLVSLVAMVLFYLSSVPNQTV